MSVSMIGASLVASVEAYHVLWIVAVFPTGRHTAITSKASGADHMNNRRNRSG